MLRGLRCQMAGPTIFSGFWLSYAAHMAEWARAAGTRAAGGGRNERTGAGTAVCVMSSLLAERVNRRTTEVGHR